MESTPVTAASSRRRLPLSRLLGVALVVVGALLSVVVASYYGYSVYAGSQLDELNAVAAVPPSLPLESLNAGFVPVVAAQTSAPAVASLPEPAPPAQTVAVAESDPTTAPKPAPSGAVDLVAIYASIYPGYQLHPKYWSEPIWAGIDPYVHEEPGLPAGFAALRGPNPATPAVDLAQARRISIPSIGVESSVSELQILDLGDSRAYETPDNTIGHIPDTANPGESGNGWFFGHLESPIRGEGNVFQHLPDIPGLLQNGDAVYITIESDDGEFLYQATQTRQIHQDDLTLHDSDGTSITLVACVPRLVYDHRLLVTAELVGVRN